MNRIAEKFKVLKKNKQKALILFITGGDPTLGHTEKLIAEFDAQGVDLLEIGVPFSDPLADGPVIQASSMRALSRGANLEKILQTVKKARLKGAKIPIVLMTYLNPILSYGLERFTKAAVSAGVDGVIFPELPADEGKDIAKILRRAKIDLIFLAAPTSPESRKKMIAKASRGFIYYVSLTGVTGVGASISGTVKKNVASLKKYSDLPVCVGFGVSTPEQAHQMASISDGVIVGSAIVKALEKDPKASPAVFFKKHIQPFMNAVKGAN